MVEGDDAVQPFEVRQLGSLVFVALRQLVGTEPSSLCGSTQLEPLGIPAVFFFCLCKFRARAMSGKATRSSEHERAARARGAQRRPVSGACQGPLCSGLA